MTRIKIVLFASLREALGESEFELEIEQANDEILNIVHVIRVLGETRGKNWLEMLTGAKVLMAINHTMVDDQHRVTAGDELAFYPPVTGG